MIMPYLNLNFNTPPTEEQLKKLTNLLEAATSEIVADLELLNYLARQWDIEIKNKYNHLLYTANKINWHVPSNMIIECTKIKACIERLEAVYREGEKDKLI